MGDEGTGDEGMGDEGTGDEGTGDEGTGDEGMGDEGMGDEGMGRGPHTQTSDEAQINSSFLARRPPLRVTSSLTPSHILADSESRLADSESRPR